MAEDVECRAGTPRHDSTHSQRYWTGDNLNRGAVGTPPCFDGKVKESLSIGLRFEQIECSCGVLRQRRVPCADCGARPAPWEADNRLQARQRAVEAAQGLVTAATAPELSLDDVLSGPAEALARRIFAAGDAVGREEPEGVDLLVAAWTEVAGMRAWADKHMPRRPLLTAANEAQTLVAAVSQLLDTAVGALTAETIPEAQAATAELNDALESAGVATGRSADLVERVSAVLDSDDPIGAWLRLALQGDMFEAAERGSELVTQHTGQAPMPGSAVTAVFLDDVFSIIGDPGRFWNLVSEQLSLLGSVHSEVVAAFAEQSVQERANAVRADILSMARRALRELDPETVREWTSNLLEVGHVVFEQPLKFHLGIACAATTRRTFAATQACDVSELTQIACDKSWSIATGLSGADARNAFAHRDFEIVDGGVSLSPHRRADRGESPVVEHAELQDLVLQLVETTAAMDLALSIVWENSGLRSRHALGLQLARSLLYGVGWDGVVVETLGDDLSITAEVDGGQPFGMIGLVVSLFRDDAQAVHLDLSRRDNTTQTSLTLPVELFIQWNDKQDGLDKEVAFIRLLSNTIQDGSPLLTAAHAQIYIAMTAAKAVADRTQAFPRVNRQLKSWRALARELGLDALQLQIGRAQRWRASAEAGERAHPEVLEGLLAMAEGDPDAPPASSALI